MRQYCNKWSVLSVFLEYPQKNWHIREISRRIKLATTSVRLHVNSLMKEGLVLESTGGVFKSCIAHFESERFRFLKRIHLLMLLEESELVAFLGDVCAPDAVYLFGSGAKGEDTEKSDIDIFVLAKECPVDLKKYEKRLRRSVQLVFSEDINKLPKELRNNILNGIKLDGYLRVF